MCGRRRGGDGAGAETKETKCAKADVLLLVKNKLHKAPDGIGSKRPGVLWLPLIYDVVVASVGGWSTVVICNPAKQSATRPLTAS